MIYKILQTHIVFKGGQIHLIAVLWQSDEIGYVRASYCTNKQTMGYMHLVPGQQISDKLIQETAGGGIDLPDDMKDTFFPGITLWER